MTATTDLQKGLNEVVMNKVHRMIDGKAAGVQATMERLINEGKIAQDYIAPIGVNLKAKSHTPVNSRLKEAVSCMNSQGS